MSAWIIALPGGEALAAALLEGLDAAICPFGIRDWLAAPAGQPAAPALAGRDVLIAGSLPLLPRQTVPLAALSDRLRAAGAGRIVLVAPYLALTPTRLAAGDAPWPPPAALARRLSALADALLTVDPLPDSSRELERLFSIPVSTVAAFPTITRWIDAHAARPMIVQLDAGRCLWTAAIASLLECPQLVMHRVRNADGSVELSVPDLPEATDRTPVIVDDAICSGRSQLAALHRLRSAGFPAPVCIGIHALFDADAASRLHGAGAQRIVSCNTLPHASNDIDIHPALVAATRSLLQRLHPQRDPRASPAVAAPAFGIAAAASGSLRHAGS